MNQIILRACAKVNLRLDILGRRADGYHDLRTIFQSISLHDTLFLERTRDRQIDLRVLGDAALAQEVSQDNLVYRALELLRRELRWASGIRAVLTKRIPAGRGLGGGSSDAASALRGGLQLSGQRLETARLLEIASQLGADVPFFLFGGRALGIGRGDEIYPLPDVSPQAVLVVSPGDVAVPTREAYGWLAARRGGRGDGSERRLTKPASAPKLMQFCALCWSPQGGLLSNDFEGVVFPRYPRLARIKRELLQQGAAEAALAGSGSAVFGIFRDPARARRAAQAFPKDQVFVCSFLSRAAYRRTAGPRI